VRRHERGPGPTLGGHGLSGPVLGRRPPLGAREALDRREVGFRPRPDGDAGWEGNLGQYRFDLASHGVFCIIHSGSATVGTCRKWHSCNLVD